MAFFLEVKLDTTMKLFAFLGTILKFFENEVESLPFGHLNDQV